MSKEMLPRDETGRRSAGSGDSTRILIERLRLRGIRNADAAIDSWGKIP